MSNIDDTLAERGERYGEFADHAEVTQSIKAAMASGNNWETLNDDMKECLEMIAHKAGRILNGDPFYVDSWTDIIGYTRLVEKRLIEAREEAVDEDIPTITLRWNPKTNKVERLNDEDAPCTDPKCPEHNPAIGQALETLRAAGILHFE